MINSGLANVTTINKCPETKSESWNFSNKPKEYTLCSGSQWRARISFLKQGYARKMRWSSRMRYSAEQIAFLKWAFSLGKWNINQKLTAEKAAELMKLVGTAEVAAKYPNEKYMAQQANGQPSFARNQLIEKYEIKSSFSRTKGADVKKAGLQDDLST